MFTFAFAFAFFSSSNGERNRWILLLVLSRVAVVVAKRGGVGDVGGGECDKREECCDGGRFIYDRDTRGGDSKIVIVISFSPSTITLSLPSVLSALLDFDSEFFPEEEAEEEDEEMSI